MGRFFSDPVERALAYIYYDPCAGKGNQGILLLEEASFAADGDASCVLANCLRGSQYVWTGHHFPKDANRAQKLLYQSVLQGSALGMLMAMRSGELRDWLKDEMSPVGLQRSFDIVLNKAEDGEAFCQYVIGNVYFRRDFMRIEGKTRDSFASEAEFNLYMGKNIAKCESWFWKAFRGGMSFAADGLKQYYMYGDTPYVLPMPEKAENLWRVGAELGYSRHQYLLAGELEKAGLNTEAIQWYKAAAEGGEPDAWYHVGRFYEEGIGVSKNISMAVHYYKLGEAQGESICSNRLDRLLYRGK